MTKPNLASISETKRVLDTFGLIAKKSLGQNFLVNQRVLDKIASLAELGADDVVLEIGPGIGTLTQVLADKAGFVYSVDLDKDMLEVLSETCKSWNSKIKIFNKDALHLRKEDFCKKLPNTFVANLPFNIGATALLKVFEDFDFVKSATVMLQKEVVERIMAVQGTKNYGAYTLKLALYAKALSKFPVKSNNVYPAPHVDSCVVRLDRTCMGLNSELVKLCKKIIDAAFYNRRKTLLNSAKSYLTNEKDKEILQVLPGVLTKLFILQNTRGEALKLEDFINIATRL
ncbi:MAG: ribosomal RNA small subunit methyltransferase A [Eggerthellaceae bacterium]|nr:ribosomal RNA small subunit methyltransferase A [Eggerthellaceae bacterium]